LVQIDDYESLYLPNFQIPRSLIRFSSFIEDAIGCDYNCTDQDLEWIESQTETHPDLKPDEFEKVVSLLEVVGDDKVTVTNTGGRRRPDYRRSYRIRD
jgi:Enhancer of polycomb-like